MSFLLVLSFALAVKGFEVSVPQRRVLGVLGQPVLLGCGYAPSDGLNGLVATWQRSEDDQVVHSFYYGRDQLDLQSGQYRNRTSLFHPQLGAGNASLRLDRVGPRDSGRYLCSINSLLGVGKAEVLLEYAALYTEPRLNIRVVSGSVSLQYESEGYPAPQVQWTGPVGRNLTAREELTEPGEDGLLSLRANVTLEDPGSHVNLSFALLNTALGQVLERQVSLSLAPAPGDLGNCTNSARLTIPIVCGLFLVLSCAGLAAFAFLRRRK